MQEGWSLLLSAISSGSIKLRLMVSRYAERVAACPSWWKNGQTNAYPLALTEYSIRKFVVKTQSQCKRSWSKGRKYRDPDNFSRRRQSKNSHTRKRIFRISLSGADKPMEKINSCQVRFTSNGNDLPSALMCILNAERQHAMTELRLTITTSNRDGNLNPTSQICKHEFPSGGTRWGYSFLFSRNFWYPGF